MRIGFRLVSHFRVFKNVILGTHLCTAGGICTHATFLVGWLGLVLKEDYLVNLLITCIALHCLGALVMDQDPFVLGCYTNTEQKIKCPQPQRVYKLSIGYKENILQDGGELLILFIYGLQSIIHSAAGDIANKQANWMFKPGIEYKVPHLETI